MKKTAIVFVHGFMGRPEQFDTLREMLTPGANADLYSILLPGHGADISAFTRAKESDWQAAVDQTLNELRERYDDLILVGHSMGGLLLIRSAIKCADALRAIYAVSLSLYLKLTPRGIYIRAGALGKSKTNPHIAAAREMCGVSGITPLNAYRLIPNALALLRIMQSVRRQLSSLRVMLTVIHSEKDEIVSVRSVRFAQKHCPAAKTVTLREASHFYFPDRETEIIAGLILRRSG